MLEPNFNIVSTVRSKSRNLLKANNPMTKQFIRHLFIYLILFSTLSISANETQSAEIIDPSAKLREIRLSHATVNNIDIAYKVIGEKDKPAILMIMGLGASHILWGDAITLQLADAGYQLILFDNRDTGESQRLDEFGQPLIWWQLLKSQFGFEVDADYTLDDMANDSIALLDELNLKRAHIVGASMGGMIAQVVAAKHAERSLSLTSIMSTPGFGDHLPPPSTEANNRLTNMANDKVDNAARLKRMGIHTESMPRQIMAILKSGDRTEDVKTIAIPTLVLHGVDDALIPIPHGEYTASLITGSKFVAIEGMGHDMSAAVMPEIINNIVRHLKSTDRTLLSATDATPIAF
jgi:pimeloyl-ACP methyl ester carboxylesterase